MDPKSMPGGGPAFPTENGRQVGNNAYLYEGMTLRDYFAAKAMQGLLAGRDSGSGDYIDDFPGAAYQIADAMLAAREA